MEIQELIEFFEHIGKDPSRLIFEDELTGIHNRRFLLHYFQSKVPWKALEDYNVSLIMMDVDHFKEINDTYGHQVGDQALIWVATLLKEVAGEEGIPVRYAGDEFMILLPLVGKVSAMQIGAQVLERFHEKPFRPEELDIALPITLSIGVASAPDDARREKVLIHKADTALYYAKKTGRNRVADAAGVVLEEVLAKTALFQLEGTKLAGRKQQLATVAAAIKKFSQRQSQFLMVEGAAGMGKTEFLAAIRRGLARSKAQQVKVSGIHQELFRPYYLMTNILVAILSQRKDKGAGVLKALSQEEIAYLAHILPQLGETEKVLPTEDEKTQREGIFSTLVRFVPKAANNRPLLLLIDDLHLSDEATLVLLRQLMLRGDIPLFICGTFTDTMQSETQEQTVPLERFCHTCHKELSIIKLTLTPLTDSDIGNHIRGLFPHVSLPEDFENKLAQITHGNPLFLGEILRKLVLDQKITLSGQKWVIQPIEKAYLPRSLEEIVTQKIAALDEESRQLLDHVSVFGEDVSLSVLMGSSDKMEAKVLEFIDKAVTQGLLTTDFQLNDETVRFLGKRVLEIAYGAIQQDRKQELHERIGNYQETLYEQHLLPSAATLAYHFKRSANQQKAIEYDQVLISSSNKIFSPAEATRYAPKQQKEILPRDVPLDPASLAQAPTVLRHFLAAVRNLKLYPPGSKSIIISNRQLKAFIDQILKNNKCLNIVQIKQALLVNGQKTDVTQFRFVSEAFVKFLNHVELKGIGFHRGLTDYELEVLLEAFSKIRRKTIAQDFWKSFCAENRLMHIDLKQMRYTMKVELDGHPMDTSTAPADAMATPAEVSSQLLAGEHRLDQEDMAKIPEIIRGLLGAARTVKLYPQNSKAVSRAAGQILTALSSILGRRPVLTLAGVKNSLFINGAKADTSGFETIANKFLQFLDSVQLTSLTFLERISAKELETFIGALDELPAVGLDSDFWKRFGKDHRLSSIFFDHHVYETHVAQTGADSAMGQSVAVPSERGPLYRQAYESGLAQTGADYTMGQSAAVPSEGGPRAQKGEPVPEELFQAFVETIPDQMTDLLLKGDEDKTKHMIRRLFQELHGRNALNREKVADVCRRSLETLTPALQHQFAKLVADPLLLFFLDEGDPKIIVQIAAILHRMATNLIDFGQYPLASRYLLHIQMRQEQLEESEDLNTRQFANTLNRKLKPITEKLLVQDLKSDQPSQRRNAALLLGSLGRVTMPLLIDIVKQEDELRVRKIAASLLEELGPKAAELLKRALVLEITAQERVRILEVIDTITRDLKNELAFVLSDEDPEVRKAAFGLAERINDGYVVELLLGCARNQDTDLAAAAIKSLGRLGIQSAVGELISLLNSTKEEKLRIACCQALGQIGDPAGMEPLAKMLTPNRLLSLSKRRSTRVRAAAAFALANISHPKAAEVLGRFVQDRDPSIRQIAGTVVNNIDPSPDISA